MRGTPWPRLAVAAFSAGVIGSVALALGLRRGNVTLIALGGLGLGLLLLIALAAILIGGVIQQMPSATQGPALSGGAVRGPLWMGAGVALEIIGVFTLLDGKTAVGGTLVGLAVVVFGLGLYWWIRFRVREIRSHQGVEDTDTR